MSNNNNNKTLGHEKERTIQSSSEAPANRGKRMSAFAESAYANATRGTSPPRQSFLGNMASKLRPGGKSAGTSHGGRVDDYYMHRTSQDYNLLYYPDSTIEGTVVEGMNNNHSYRNNTIVHAEFQPLVGASVVIITATSKTDKVDDPVTLKIMEERESIGCTVESMGGRWVPTLEFDSEPITHAIWIGDGDEECSRTKRGDTIWNRLASDALNRLSICQSMDIPVVNTSWLSSISGLNPGQHWSEVDVETHKPFVVKVLEKYNRITLERKSAGSSSRHIRTSSRRDTSSKLSASIGMTYNSLLNENPDLVEEDSIKRAMELSMLDFAIVHHISKDRRYTNMSDHQRRNCNDEKPHDILGINEDATLADIKQAYRQRALETHPDKGGKPGEFEAVARAYRVLLNASNKNGLDVIQSEDSFDNDRTIVIKSTAHWDSELKEHRNLVQELYTNHGQDVEANITRQTLMLERLGLCVKDAGSQTINERKERISNSCFYLSLACSYLSGIGALEIWDVLSEDGVQDDHQKAMLREADGTLIMDTALSLKRTIEAAVLSAHPEWAARGVVGEEVQAFSDFLVYTLESQTIVSDWAVVVFDTCSGFADVYKGKGYKDDASPDDKQNVAAEAYAASNTITIQYVSGHYQPLVVMPPKSSRPSLKKILSALDEFGVLYVVTDGAAKPK